MSLPTQFRPESLPKGEHEKSGNDISLRADSISPVAAPQGALKPSGQDISRRADSFSGGGVKRTAGEYQQDRLYSGSPSNHGWPKPAMAAVEYRDAGCAGASNPKRCGFDSHPVSFSPSVGLHTPTTKNARLAQRSPRLQPGAEICPNLFLMEVGE